MGFIEFCLSIATVTENNISSFYNILNKFIREAYFIFYFFIYR